jgi:hypothetical protein
MIEPVTITEQMMYCTARIVGLNAIPHEGWRSSPARNGNVSFCQLRTFRLVRLRPQCARNGP